MDKAEKHEIEVLEGKRFEFGANWGRFLAIVDDDRIQLASESLKKMLGKNDLKGKRFCDVGCGSGLFSLAAINLGASVYSLDYDPQSVACTRELKRRYYPDSQDWVIEEGSILDDDYIKSLGTFDIVYSWGVLHHTGSMWKALDNVMSLVAHRGQLFIAIYNDQGRKSKIWLYVKKAYNALPKAFRWIVLYPVFVILWGPATLRDLVIRKPFRTWLNYSSQRSRGMGPWVDVVDWVGGLPFEVARPEDILNFYCEREFRLDKMTTCLGGFGCNEYVFTKE